MKKRELLKIQDQIEWIKLNVPHHSIDPEKLRLLENVVETGLKIYDLRDTVKRIQRRMKLSKQNSKKAG